MIHAPPFPRPNCACRRRAMDPRGPYFSGWGLAKPSHMRATHATTVLRIIHLLRRNTVYLHRTTMYSLVTWGDRIVYTVCLHRITNLFIVTWYDRILYTVCLHRITNYSLVTWYDRIVYTVSLHTASHDTQALEVVCGPNVGFVSVVVR